MFSSLIQFPREIINILLTLFSRSVLYVTAPCFFHINSTAKNAILNLQYTPRTQLVRDMYKFNRTSHPNKELSFLRFIINVSSFFSSLISEISQSTEGYDISAEF